MPVDPLEQLISSEVLVMISCGYDSGTYFFSSPIVGIQLHPVVPVPN
jgi:hypothetical protein